MAGSPRPDTRRDGDHVHDLGEQVQAVGAVWGSGIQAPLSHLPHSRLRLMGRSRRPPLSHQVASLLSSAPHRSTLEAAQGISVTALLYGLGLHTVDVQ